MRINVVLLSSIRVIKLKYNYDKAGYKNLIFCISYTVNGKLSFKNIKL